MTTDNQIVGAKRESILNDLFLIGRSKPIGCLPVRTIKRCGYTAEQLIEELNALGLETFIAGTVCTGEFAEGYTFFSRESLYAYHHLYLTEFLQRNRDLIIKSQWPIEPSEFAHRVHQESVMWEINPALYACIGRAFNDPRFNKQGV